jgi:multidrug efflux pump subunit AcrB
VKRAIAWFAENHVAANLLMGIIVIAGLAALPRTPQKTFPDIDIKMITIGVPYLGAAPEEVEEGVCIRIEEELDGIDGVERVRSTATEGACAVTVELFEDADESVALDDVKNRVDAIDTFPEETEKPVLSLVTPKRSVMEIAITGPDDERTLKVIGQRVRDEIAALPGITQVELANVRPYEISIEVSEENLRRHSLSFDQVANAVRRSSLDLPGGSIKTADGEILLRTKGQAYRGAEFEKLVVLTRTDGTRVLLRDVADVIDGFEDTDQWVQFEGRPAAIVRVFRVGNQDTLKIAATLRGYLAEAGGRLPEGVELTVWSDMSSILRDRLDTLLSSARLGFLMVLLLLALFLRPRLSFWVSVGVPVSFLGAICLASVLGLSIDSISIFGFILVLGILVDDAIVIGENVHTLQQQGGDQLQSAIRGAQGVSIPVIFGVLTTMAAFMPLLLSTGTIGQIDTILATVVMVCLIFSLIESQLVLPAHLGHRHATRPAAEVALMLAPILALVLFELSWDLRSYLALLVVGGATLIALYRGGALERFAETLLGWQSEFAVGLEHFTHRTFRRWIELALAWRYSTVAVATALLLSALGVLASGRLPFSFFPAIESDRVSARLTMPLGTSAHVTEAALRELERSASELRAELDRDYSVDARSPVRHSLTALGGHPVSTSGGPPIRAGRTTAGAGGHLGEVTLELMPSQARDISTRAVAQRWRELTDPIPDAVELQFESSLFSVGSALDIQLQGDNVDELREAATRVRAKLGEYPGVIDIADSFRSGKQELKLRILPSGEALGLTLNDLARQVRQAFYGEEAQRIQRGRDDVRVMVRYTEAERRSLGSLEGMRIRTPDGSEVPFAAVARADLGRGFSSIKRVDRQRVVNVTADVDRTKTTSNQVLANLGTGGLEEILRDYPGVSYRLEGEQREQSEAVEALLPLFVIALFLIYALLGVPLRSYIQPLVIMSVIPFALVGAIVGHLLMGAIGIVRGLSFMSALGFIAASGVVVNASLVLMHYVNQRLASGASIREAARDASLARFRPIVLSSLTTFAGLTPLMFNRSVQAQFMVPMAISLAYGVLFATLITLLVVPSGLLILDDLRGLRRRRPQVAVVADSKKVA